jgi:hypothetical protein
VDNDDAVTIDPTDSDGKSDGGVLPGGVTSGIKSKDVEVKNVRGEDEGSNKN